MDQEIRFSSSYRNKVRPVLSTVKPNYPQPYKELVRGIITRAFQDAVFDPRMIQAEGSTAKSQRVVSMLDKTTGIEFMRSKRLEWWIDHSQLNINAQCLRDEMERRLKEERARPSIRSNLFAKVA